METGIPVPASEYQTGGLGILICSVGQRLRSKRGTDRQTDRQSERETDGLGVEGGGGIQRQREEEKEREGEREREVRKGGSESSSEHPFASHHHFCSALLRHSPDPKRKKSTA